MRRSLSLSHQAIFTIAFVMMFVIVLMIEYILSIMIQDVDNCYKYFVVMMMGYHSMCQYQHIFAPKV